MPDLPNFYEMLDLPPDATTEEIRHAYREAARRFHPDTRDSAMQTGLFLQLQEAYEILSSPSKRKQYDQKLQTELEASEPISLQITFSRSKLTHFDEPQLIYTLLELTPKDDQQISKPPVNVCLLIDRSTSMQGERMDTVKIAAIELTRRLQADDLLTIIAFSDRAEVMVSAGRSKDQVLIENQIRMIHAAGGTEIFQGLDLGYAEIQRHLHKSAINHIILLTDGRTYGDEEECLALARRLATEGIRITTLGIGTEWNDDFTDALAALTGGSSYYISETPDIKNFLQEKFQSLGNISAEQVALHWDTSTEASLNNAYRLQPDSTELITESPLRLGSVPSSSQLSLLLEFVISPLPEALSRYTIATGEFSLVIPAESPKKQKLPINLNRLIGDPPDTDQPPKKILQALSQISLFRMQDRAHQEVADGKVAQASLRLQRLATQLISLGENELAEAILEESQQIKQTHVFSAEGKKEIKYGTRSLILPPQAEGEL